MTRMLALACVASMSGLATITMEISKSTGNVAGHSGLAGLAGLATVSCGFLLPWIELEFAEVVIFNLFGERMIL